MCSAVYQVHVPSDCAPDQAKELSDSDLCDLIQQHLHIDAKPHFASNAQSGAPQGKGRAGGAGPSKRPAAAVSGQPVDVDKWVADTLELVEMERQAEVDQATEATAMCSPETAQVRGQS